MRPGSIGVVMAVVSVTGLAVVEVGGRLVVVGGAGPAVDVVEDDELGAAVVVGAVVVDGTNRTVGPEFGWASVDSPVGPDPLRSRAVPATTNPKASTATTAKTTVLLLLVGLWARHHSRKRFDGPGRPKAAFFPMDR